MYVGGSVGSTGGVGGKRDVGGSVGVCRWTCRWERRCRCQGRGC